MDDKTVLEIVANQFGVQAKTVESRWNRWVDAACHRAGYPNGIESLNSDEYRLALISFGNACSHTSSRSVRVAWEKEWAERHRQSKAPEVVEGELVDNCTIADLTEDFNTSAIAIRKDEQAQLLDELREDFFLSDPFRGGGLAGIVASSMAPQVELLERQVETETFRQLAGAVGRGRKAGISAFLSDLKEQAESQYE